MRRNSGGSVANALTFVYDANGNETVAQDSHGAYTMTFDALNLTNETIKMYAENKDRPRAFYSNGRTFYLGLRGKL